MDKKQLVTIAVTALISVIAKEVVTWLVSLAKSKALSKTIKEKAKSALTRSVLLLIWYLIWLSTSVVLLVHDLRRPGPVSPGDVMAIVTSYLGSLAASGFTLFQTLTVIFEWQSKKQSHVAAQGKS